MKNNINNFKVQNKVSLDERNTINQTNLVFFYKNKEKPFLDTRTFYFSYNDKELSFILKQLKLLSIKVNRKKGKKILKKIQNISHKYNQQKNKNQYNQEVFI